MSIKIKNLPPLVTNAAIALIVFGTLSAASRLGAPIVSEAQAACAATAPLVIVCPTDDPDGFEFLGDLDSFSVLDGVTLTYTPGFPRPTVGIAGALNTFVNSGTILAPSAFGLHAVFVDGLGGGGFTNSGTITSQFGVGFLSTGDTVGPVINDGTISGTDGIVVIGRLASLVNTGKISGTFNDGIYADETGLITNRGHITGAENAIYIENTLGALFNSGTLLGGEGGLDSDIVEFVNNTGLIQGVAEDGIFAETSIGTLTNSGTIFGGIDGVHSVDIGTLINMGLMQGGTYEGVFALGRIGVLTNFGTIGGGDDGVEADELGLLVNFGTIRGEDDGVDVSEGTLDHLVNYGLISGGINNPGDRSGVVAALIRQITNAGTISGDDFAIEERGAGGDTNLTLNAGSILIGAIQLGGGTNVLNIGEGLSLNSTFLGLTDIGKIQGHLFARLGDQVVAIDQSTFNAFDDALAALTSGIGGTLGSRQRSLRTDPSLSFASRFAAANEPGLAAFSSLESESQTHLDPNRFWIEGFGAFRQDETDRVGSDFDQLTGGLILGADVPLDSLTTLGAMGGFAGNQSENELNTLDISSHSFFAGFYGSTQAMGLDLDASLTAGYTSYEQDRITANNLVATGLETATSDFGGWFINPRLSVTRQAANPLSGKSLGSLLASASIEQSLTLDYAALFLDGSTETGTTNPLTLHNRVVQIASSRAALTLPFERFAEDGSRTALHLTTGIGGRIQFGDDTVSGSILGQAVSTGLDDDDALGLAFLGLGAIHETTGGLTAYANAEAQIETDASLQISVNAGLRIAF